jgi:hypothetical protein
MRYEVFYEDQQMGKLRWLIVALFTIIPIMGVCTVILEHGRTDMIVVTVILCVAFSFLIFVAVFFALETTVNNEGINVRLYIRHLPAWMKFYDEHLSWEEIEHVSVDKYKYKSLAEIIRAYILRLPGLGLINTFSTTLLTAQNTGLHILLRNGRKMFVNTNEPDNLKYVLKRLGKLDEQI